MGKLIRIGVLWATGVGLTCGMAWGQVRERDVSVTGPGGRTLQRSVQTQRGPGFVDRQVQVQRPGGSFSSNTMVQRGFGGGGARGSAPGPRWGGGPGFGPRWGWYGPRPPIIVNQGAPWWPALAVGGGLFGLGLFAGSALSSPPPPPPVIVAAPPAYVAAPVVAAPVVAAAPAQPVAAAPPPGTPGVDPLADALGRLRSHHDQSRRDGAYTLGRIGDDRAVPALIDRLKNDGSKDVRIAAATALGEIGDPRATVALDRARIYDRRDEVRVVATRALERIQRESTPDLPSNIASTPSTSPSAVVPAAAPIEDVPPPPAPDAPVNVPTLRRTP